MKSDRYLIIIENDNAREAVRGLLQMLKDDGRPISDIEIEDCIIYIKTKGDFSVKE